MSSVTDKNTQSKEILIRSKKSSSGSFKINYGLIRDVDTRKKLIEKLIK
jgi:hypothetical protein